MAATSSLRRTKSSIRRPVPPSSLSRSRLRTRQRRTRIPRTKSSQSNFLVYSSATGTSSSNSRCKRDQSQMRYDGFCLFTAKSQFPPPSFPSQRRPPPMLRKPLQIGGDHSQAVLSATQVAMKIYRMDQSEKHLLWVATTLLLQASPRPPPNVLDNIAHHSGQSESRTGAPSVAPTGRLISASARTGTRRQCRRCQAPRSR